MQSCSKQDSRAPATTLAERGRRNRAHGGAQKHMRPHTHMYQRPPATMSRPPASGVGGCLSSLLSLFSDSLACITNTRCLAQRSLSPCVFHATRSVPFSLLLDTYLMMVAQEEGESGDVGLCISQMHHSFLFLVPKLLERRRFSYTY